MKTLGKQIDGYLKYPGVLFHLIHNRQKAKKSLYNFINKILSDDRAKRSKK